MAERSPKGAPPATGPEGGGRWVAWRWQVAFGVALLVPVVWTDRVQAIDMASHTYGAWLTRLVREGGVSGLEIVPAGTNVLVDLILAGLGGSIGWVWAERIVACFVLLVFVAGVGAWVRAATGSRVLWPVAPLLLVAAHGTVTQTGLMSYLLALGFGAGAGALALHRPNRWPVALILGVAAWLAHSMGALIFLGMSAYVYAFRTADERFRVALFLSALLLVGATGLVAEHVLDTIRTRPALSFLGVYTVVPFRANYAVAAVIYLFLLGWAIVVASRAGASRRFVDSLPVHLFLLTCIAYQALPSAFHVEGHGAWVTYVPQRIALVVMIAVITMVLAIPNRRAVFVLASVLAIAYFAPLRSDHRIFDQHDALLREAVRSAPAGSRLVYLHAAPDYLMDPLRTSLDRACLEHCFSYFHYKPSTLHFPLRAYAPNEVVVADYRIVAAFNQGHLRAREDMLPLLAVRFRDGAYHLESVEVGEGLIKMPLRLTAF